MNLEEILKIKCLFHHVLLIPEEAEREEGSVTNFLSCLRSGKGPTQQAGPIYCCHDSWEGAGGRAFSVRDWSAGRIGIEQTQLQVQKSTALLASPGCWG